MNCKKYRACLVGLIAAALVCGLLIYMKNVKNNEVPVDGTLVKHCVEFEDGSEVWA